MDALESLKPRFIQCLFSYINFFFTLENGFQVLLSELCELNSELGLELKAPKRPKRTAYIHKLPPRSEQHSRPLGRSGAKDRTRFTRRAFLGLLVAGCGDRLNGFGIRK